MSWQKVKLDCYPGHREKKITKKYAKEISNILNNLRTYFDSLEKGIHPETLKRCLSFVHEEKEGVFAIDQRPPKSGVQLRLYVFPDMENKILYVIILGDKQSQSKDIKIAHKEVRGIKNG